MDDHASDMSGVGDLCGCKSLSPPFMFPTDLGSSRATGWIATQCVSISKPLAISVIASPTKSVVAASGTRRLANMWLLRVSHLIFVPGEPGTEELVVDLVPAAQHRAPLMVAPSVPATTPQKKVPAKGKAPIHQTTCPHAR